MSIAGAHLRYVPGSLAESMVRTGQAVIESTNGRVRSIRLTEQASTHAELLGAAEGRMKGVRFYRWEHLDCGARIVAHHRRATDYQD